MLKKLKSGDLIGIVAPAGKIKRESLDVAIEILKSWGLQVKTGEHLFSNAHGYFSGADEERLEDFQTMLNDPKVSAIMCARGGYGTTRIIDQLNFKEFLKNPKWIIGFSDVTALHLKLHQLGLESIHSVMPIQFPKPEHNESVESLRRTLFGEPIQLNANSSMFNRIGTASGQVIGGNLTLLADSLGTATDINTSGKILVIEEVDEYRYRLDRMLTHLKRANKLSGLAGLVIGHMTDIHDTEIGFGQTVEEIVLDKVKEHTYPVAFNFPTGHEAPNLAWRHGAVGHLKVDKEQSQLTFEEINL